LIRKGDKTSSSSPGLFTIKRVAKQLFNVNFLKIPGGSHDTVAAKIYIDIKAP
jgi:hypothetical protein